MPGVGWLTGRLLSVCQHDRTTRQRVPLGVECSEELGTSMIADCSGFCGGYSGKGGDQISWEGCSDSEDHMVETQRLTDNRMACFAALQVQDLAKTIFRGEEPPQESTGAQGHAAFPTPQEFL